MPARYATTPIVYREYEIVHEEHEPGPSGRDEREGHRHKGSAEHSRAHDRDRNRDRNRDRSRDRSRHENGHSDRKRSDDRDRRRDREDGDRNRCGGSCKLGNCRRGSMHSSQSKPCKTVRIDLGIDSRSQAYSVFHALSIILGCQPGIWNAQSINGVQGRGLWPRQGPSRGREATTS